MLTIDPYETGMTSWHRMGWAALCGALTHPQGPQVEAELMPGGKSVCVGGDPNEVLQGICDWAWKRDEWGLLASPLWDDEEGQMASMLARSWPSDGLLKSLLSHGKTRTIGKPVRIERRPGAAKGFLLLGPQDTLDKDWLGEDSIHAHAFVNFPRDKGYARRAPTFKDGAHEGIARCNRSRPATAKGKPRKWMNAKSWAVPGASNKHGNDSAAGYMQQNPAQIILLALAPLAAWVVPLARNAWEGEYYGIKPPYTGALVYPAHDVDPGVYMAVRAKLAHREVQAAASVHHAALEMACALEDAGLDPAVRLTIYGRKIWNAHKAIVVGQEVIEHADLALWRRVREADPVTINTKGHTQKTLYIDGGQIAAAVAKSIARGDGAWFESLIDEAKLQLGVSAKSASILYQHKTINQVVDAVYGA